MTKTSLKQKLSLIILGLFLAVLLLEIGLRIAGTIVFYLQQQQNHLSFKGNAYRILCLGESTTALGGEDSYPSQLEALLNTEARPFKFTVINEGIISTTTKYILEHVDQNLDKYRPQLVIVMMGINDKAYLHYSSKRLWWKNIKSYLEDFRVYKLGHLLYERITHQGIYPPQAIDRAVHDGNDQKTEDFLKILFLNGLEKYQEHLAKHELGLARQSAVETSTICVQLAQRYRLHGLLAQAQQFLEHALALDPNNPVLYQEWGELYLARKENAQALNAFQVALALDPQNSDVLLGLAHTYYAQHNDKAFLFYAGYLRAQPRDYWRYIELAQWLRDNKHYEQAQMYLKQAIEIGPYFDQGYLDLGQTLDDERQYAEEEAFYLKEISLYPESHRLYQALGQLYQRQGRGDLAQKFFQKETRQEMAEYAAVTLANYRLILDKILDRHIKVIVMQYPLREIGPLKDYLGTRKGVIFLENRQNFKQALLKEGYNYYFKDNFAYDFGHCTRAGNALIARNLMDTILNKALLE